MGNYKPQEFAEMIGVSVKTLQRWDNDGILKANRTPTNRRYYTHKQYVDYMSDGKTSGGKTIIYGLRKYKKQIEGDEEIAKELQNRNQPY